jgi:large subunit ribosomal protein L30e
MIDVDKAITGKAKMIVLAANCPKDIKDQVEYYGKISKVPVMTYKSTAIDLAAVCNKLFVISALSIRETGDSEILKAIENNESEENSGGIE